MDSLPDFLLLKIFAHFEVGALVAISGVSKTWYRIAHDWQLWQRVNLEKYNRKLGDTRLRRLVQTTFPAQLYHLDLTGFNVSTGTLYALKVECPHLKCLILAHVTFLETFPITANDVTVRLLYFPGKLKKLDISYSTGPPSVYLNLVRSLRVERLRAFIGGDDFLGSFKEESTHKIMELFLRQNGSLQSVKFEYCDNMTDRLLTMILCCCRALRTLSVRRCRKIDGVFLRLALNLAPSLKILILDGTMITDDIICGLDWTSCKLTILDLSWCRHISENGLLAALPNLTHLRGLLVSCCGYGHALTDNVLSRLTRPNCLERLDLSYSYVITEKALREFLLSCTSLCYLRLMHCKNLTRDVFDGIAHLQRAEIHASFPVENGSLVFQPKTLAQ